MTRTPRSQEPGIYHLTTRGARQLPIFIGDVDRSELLVLFGAELQRRSWICHAYCLMTNHYHLIVETTEPNLSAGMQQLNCAYSTSFNRRHGFHGHAFDNRFKATAVESNAHLLVAARYVVLNPVRAGICSHPGDWPWSSYRATAGWASDPLLAGSWLLEEFGRTPERARAAYVEFVADELMSFVTLE